MEEAGEGAINIRAIAEKLNRKTGSVRTRVLTLRSSRGLGTAKKKFTLEEDMILLEELVIPRLRAEKLSGVKLKSSDYAELTERFRKSRSSVLLRWVSVLQPWLLQFYSGTLNLRIKVILADHIRDTYSDFSAIDWAKVAANKELAGNTAASLRQLYFGSLKIRTIRNFKLGINDVTMAHISDYCKQTCSSGKSRLTKSSEERRGKIINFFQKKVEELGIRDFI